MSFENRLENQNASVEDIEYQKKKAKIEQIKQDVEKWIDKLGKKIDEGIKDTIVFLSVLEINTTGSCEGHFDSGTGGPYIDIESKEIPELDKRLQESKNEEETEKISAEIERKNLEERKKIMGYLEEFYKDRNVLYNRRIIIRPMARGWSRLESQGVDLQKIESENIIKQNFAEYQKEMTDFTKFLINKYFGS